MKKTVVIAIILVYIASIVIVNFFGLEISIFDGNTYVSEIRCDNLYLQSENGGQIPYKNERDGMKFFSFEYDDSGEPYTKENIGFNPNTVVLQYHVYPENANNKKVSFIYDETLAGEDWIFLKDKASVIFLAPQSSITVTIRSTDGSNKEEKIYIFCRRKSRKTSALKLEGRENLLVYA